MKDDTNTNPFLVWCRKIDSDHCQVTLEAASWTPEWKNRAAAMSFAQKAFAFPISKALYPDRPVGQYSQDLPLWVVASTAYVITLTFRRVFFPLG